MEFSIFVTVDSLQPQIFLQLSTFFDTIMKFLQKKCYYNSTLINLKDNAKIKAQKMKNFVFKWVSQYSLTIFGFTFPTFSKKIKIVVRYHCIILQDKKD